MTVTNCPGFTALASRGWFTSRRKVKPEKFFRLTILNMTYHSEIGRSLPDLSEVSFL